MSEPHPGTHLAADDDAGASRAADAAATAAAQDAAVDALSALGARLRSVSTLLSDQVVAQRAVLDVDWRGAAFQGFADAVLAGTEDLGRLVARVDGLADDVARRALLLRGLTW